MKLATRIEAILYLKGQPLTLMDIAQWAECEVDTAQEAMMELISRVLRRLVAALIPPRRRNRRLPQA